MISPIDGRYSDKEVEKYLGEDAILKQILKVESALLYAHMKRKGFNKRYRFKINKSEILAEEERTHHQIKAIVNVMKKYVDREHKGLVHLGATSSDIYDTANSMMIRDATLKLIVPIMGLLIHKVRSLINDHEDTVQIGRTHGQHAIPMTFGHAMLEYYSRMQTSFRNVIKLAKEMGGKISGAVGNYQAMSLIMKNPMRFELDILEELGIPKAECYSQIIEPEYLLRLLLEINLFFGIVANLADDLRNLQRSEIDEVRETFGKHQIGSSTMPQKRNPWNSEHVKSLWKAFTPRVMTFYMDQISDHQRDLTGSASGRFVPEYLAGFYSAVSRMNSILDGLYINKDKMKDTCDNTLWISEAIYVLLADKNIFWAYKLVRQISTKSKDNREFMSMFREGYPNLYYLIFDDMKKIDMINRYIV